MKHNKLITIRQMTLITVLCLLAAVIAFTGCSAQNKADGAASTTAAQAEAMITAEQAKEAALKDTGLTAESVTFTETKLDQDDGVAVYEVDFHTADAKYEYEIDAVSGRICSKSVEKNAQQIPADSTADIGLDKAKALALADAGLTDAVFTSAKQDSENGRKLYEIEFHTEATKYDYEIDAATGRILNKESEPRSTSTVTPTSTGNAVENDIGLERAKAIALADAGLASATFTKAKKAAGGSVYELEFMTETTEYEYDIYAGTGAIIEKSSEQIETPAPTVPSANYIGIDQAKQIALQRAGKTASEVIFSKAKLEKENGRHVYELEFYAGNTEYSCTIDAADASILEYEVENDEDEADEHNQPEEDDDEEDEDDDD